MYIIQVRVNDQNKIKIRLKRLKLPKIGFINLGNLASNPKSHNFSQFKVSSKHFLTERKKILVVKNYFVKKRS